MKEKTPQLAQRITRLTASPIRDILKVLERPRMISFAGGLPAVETFPDLRTFDAPSAALQYGPTEGDWHLRELIAENLAAIDLQVSPNQVLILSGSQQGIDLVAKLVVDNLTSVAVESPTYLAALQVFSLFGAKFETFSPNQLGHFSNDSINPAMLYVNPTFQNPTGYCYSQSQRKQLAEICDRKGTLIFEDDPYRDLAYDTTCRRPICSYSNAEHWVYQSSFSKTFAPGLRLGFLTCSEPLVKYLTHLKQAADLHSNRLSQHLIYQHLSDSNDKMRLLELVNTYRVKRDLFNRYLEQHLGSLAEWTIPSGGLFFWLKLKTDPLIDTRQLLVETLKRNVAFMPGEPFFAHNQPAVGQLRLNFSLSSEREMDHGLSILAELIIDFREKNSRRRLTAPA